MKKILALVLTLVLLLSLVTLVGCNDKNNKTESTEVQAGIPNPLKEQTSIDSLNSEVGCNIPNCDILNQDSCTYTTVEGNPTIAQIQFSYKDGQFTFRSAKTTDDISGLYVQKGDDTVVVGDICPSNQTPMAVSDNEYYARWMDGDYQYSLYGISVDKKLFTEVYNKIHQ